MYSLTQIAKLYMKSEKNIIFTDGNLSLFNIGHDCTRYEIVFVKRGNQDYRIICPEVLSKE